MIKLINEELNMYSCGIADLTAGQAAAFLKQWNSGATIGSLTVFYDSDGKIVLNADNKNFEKCKEIVIEYLQLSEVRKIDLKETTITETFKSIFAVIDAALQYRKKKAEKQALNAKWEPIKYMLDNQTGMRFDELKELREQFYDGKSVYSAIENIYSYGVIQGKRLERAKKKKVSACKDFVQA